MSDFAPGGPLWNAYDAKRRYCIRPQDPRQPIVLDAHPAGARDPLPDQCITAQRVRLRDGLYYLEGNVQVIRSQGSGQIRADVTLATLGSLILSDLNPYDLRSAFNDPQRGAPLLVAGQAITITTTSSFEWQGMILANGGAVTLSTVVQTQSNRGAIYGRALRLNGGTLDLTFDPAVCPVGIARVELLR